MNLNPLNNSNNHNNIYYSSQITSNSNYPEIGPSIQYKIGNQDIPKNIQYFPIVTKGSVTGENTIYLAAEDNQMSNNYLPKYENEYSNKNINKKNKEKIISIMPQRSIGIKIQKSNFEYLLNWPSKKENEKIKEKNNVIDNENNDNKNIPIKEEEIEVENNNNKYNDVQNDFISTARILMARNQTKKRKELAHSFSVENYSGVLNKSLSILNLAKLENSKIMDENFIKGMRDSKRKDNLMKAIEKYRRFKSLGKNNISNLNNSFTLGLGNDQNKYKQKSIEKIYRMKSNYNIIEEDENENSDNDTIKKKSEIIKLDDSKNNKNEKTSKKTKLVKIIKIRDDDDNFGNVNDKNLNNIIEENKKLEIIKNNNINKKIIYKKN